MVEMHKGLADPPRCKTDCFYDVTNDDASCRFLNAAFLFFNELVTMYC